MFNMSFTGDEKDPSEKHENRSFCQDHVQAAARGAF